MAAATTASVGYWLPLITAVAGFASGGFTEWARDRRTYKRERDARDSARRSQQVDQRNEFQRKTLVDLQDAAMTLMQATTALHQFDLLSYVRVGKWHHELYPAEIDRDDQLANAATAILGVRVRDEEVRTLLQQSKDRLYEATVLSTNIENSRLAMREAGNKFVELNERIGEVLRTLFSSVTE